MLSNEISSVTKKRILEVLIQLALKEQKRLDGIYISSMNGDELMFICELERVIQYFGGNYKYVPLYRRNNYETN